ncbi:beta-N-acetylhexosaminidase [Terrimonas alba]|uniref:beta-N-acetylhexosaminidase n=1 Tax=Terrimonas alba TaxID=3349636 RepID=UPI0035F4BE25
MMKKILFFLMAYSCFAANSQPGSGDIALIPQPVSLVKQTGSFVLPDQLTVYVGKNPEVKRLGNRLAERITLVTGRKVEVSENENSSSTGINLVLSAGKSIPKEGYTLDVKTTHVVLEAAEPAGLFYGLQTLFQLLPKEIESTKRVQKEKWEIPAVQITDHPRFGWRGLMLDVSRHFFTKEQVKQFIDDMVKYKFNLLHWHLTDDQGWRIEIKSLPRLTSVGAWRVDKTGRFNTFSKPEPNEPKTYGGFYTHEDIKEIVQYAKDRFVDILPEVDVPGHSLAAIAAYPELTTCTPGKYEVNSGEPFMVWPPGGHFYGLIDNALCPANEKVYGFMDKIFTEVAQLFPFEYIHMGGDETARNFWEKSEPIKALMKKEKLKNLDEVQSYFVKRMGKIIESKGKKMIGWDEILQGGLAPGAAVMSWRGAQGGVEAAKLGHEVVMSPNDFVYIDLMQGDAIIEPPVYSSIRLKKTYQFEPIPEGANPALIKGGQANLWTEQVYNMRHAQYMTWPRAFAVSEILWSPKTVRNWNGFVSRVEKHFERFDESQTKYAPSMYDPIFEVSKKDPNTVIVKMSTEVEGLDIHYSFDNSFPDQFYPKYIAPLTVPKDAGAMKVITYRNGKAIGRMIVMPREELNKRAKIK